MLYSNYSEFEIFQLSIIAVDIAIIVIDYICVMVLMLTKSLADLTLEILAQLSRAIALTLTSLYDFLHFFQILILLICINQVSQSTYFLNGHLPQCRYQILACHLFQSWIDFPLKVITTSCHQDCQ